MSTEREEVLSIADGRSRAEIRVRAGNAFGFAREIFRAYPGFLSVEKRTGAFFRALAWQEVLEFLDWAELDEFRAEDMLSTGWEKEPLYLRIWRKINIAGWIRTVVLAYRIIFAPGKVPLQFYKEGDDG